MHLTRTQVNHVSCSKRPKRQPTPTTKQQPSATALCNFWKHLALHTPLHLETLPPHYMAAAASGGQSLPHLRESSLSKGQPRLLAMVTGRPGQQHPCSQHTTCACANALLKQMHAKKHNSDCVHHHRQKPEKHPVWAKRAHCVWLTLISLVMH